MEHKLDLCPCCEGEARYDTIIGEASVRAICKKCGLSTQYFSKSIHYCAKDKAAETWNTRPEKDVMNNKKDLWEITDVITIFPEHNRECHCKIKNRNLEFIALVSGEDNAERICKEHNKCLGVD